MLPIPGLQEDGDTLKGEDPQRIPEKLSPSPEVLTREFLENPGNFHRCVNVSPKVLFLGQKVFAQPLKTLLCPQGRGHPSLRNPS